MSLLQGLEEQANGSEKLRNAEKAVYRTIGSSLLQFRVIKKGPCQIKKKKRKRIYETKQRDRTRDPELGRGLTQLKRTFLCNYTSMNMIWVLKR